MAAANETGSLEVGKRWKQYAAGGPYDLRADSPDGRSAARRIVLLAAGDLTLCTDAADVDRPLTGLPAGYVHDAYCSRVTPTVAIVVYW